MRVLLVEDEPDLGATLKRTLQELCKRLRLKNNSIPILLLTAKNPMEDKVAGLDAGADDYLIGQMIT
ncbi:MAG: hypothetical protein NVS2B14_22150 [Chamaesiphon sp.]